MTESELQSFMGRWCDLDTPEGTFTNGRIIMFADGQTERVLCWDNPAGEVIHFIPLSDVRAIRHVQS